VQVRAIAHVPLCRAAVEPEDRVGKLLVAAAVADDAVQGVVEIACPRGEAVPERTRCSEVGGDQQPESLDVGTPPQLAVVDLAQRGLRCGLVLAPGEPSRVDSAAGPGGRETSRRRW